jgi:hypothetical protein
VAYVCKAVDEAHPVLANQVRWIAALAATPGIDHVHVLTSKLGRATLPDNVDVHVFGSRPPLQVLRASVRFYLRLLGPARGSDVIFQTKFSNSFPNEFLNSNIFSSNPLIT